MNLTHTPGCIPTHLFHSSLFFSPFLLSLFPSAQSLPYALGTMALRLEAPVYVALSLASLCCVCLAAVNSGSSTSLSGLLPPYDELYYRGVRAYFSEDWEKAAEFIELSISTREALRKIRRKCHDDCSTAGDEIVARLGSLQHSCQFFTITKQPNQAEKVAR